MKGESLSLRDISWGVSPENDVNGIVSLVSAALKVGFERNEENVEASNEYVW
jgi:hypothetical protein